MTNMRSIFQATTGEIIREEEKLIVLLGDIGVWAFRNDMAQFPDRVINMGILEQAMVSFAAGLSASGFFPVVHSIAPFLVERALEQIKVDFGYQSLAGNFVSVGGSFDYAALGGTHHAPGDVDALLSIPNIQILVPGHFDELAAQMRTNFLNSHISYFRLSELQNSQAFLQPGQKIKVLQSGELGNVIAIGPTGSSVLEATTGENVTVIYLNELANLTCSEICRLIHGVPTVVVEPFYQASTAQLFFQDSLNVHNNLRFEGISRDFVHSYGSMTDQLQKSGLSPEALRLRVMRHFNVAS